LRLVVDMETLKTVLERNGDLSQEQAVLLAQGLASPEHPDDLKKSLLTALADKGESVTEVTAFAATFRGLARDPEVSEWASHAIDVCGTGGDHSGSFNISTVVSFMVAAAGAPVFKHGNRSITSQCGSADLLEAVGIRLQSDPDTIRQSLKTINFCFFFAPDYHPAFKAIMPVRKALAGEGRRSIFNILGPLINPGRPAHQLLGVFAESWVKSLAQTLNCLGLKRGLVAHSVLGDDRGMDELTCAGDNRVAGCGELADVDTLWTPESLDLERCAIEDLAGGDAGENCRLLMDIADNRGPQGLRDTICLNTGAALWVADKVDTVSSGIKSARQIMADGSLKGWLDAARSFYRS